MTISDYRLMVALRWSDLESLRVKDIPVKIHLQKLRNYSKWPTCGIYDEASENGPERFRRGTRKTSSYSSADDVVEIIVRRKKSDWRAVPGVDGEVLEVTECDSDGNTVTGSDQESDLEQDGSDEGVALPFDSKYLGRGVPGRAYERAVRNNAHIASERKRLRTVLKKLEGSLRASVDLYHSTELRTSIASISQKLSLLRTQISDLPDLPKDFGTAVPPPAGLGRHKCNRCVECERCSYCRAYGEFLCGCNNCVSFISANPVGSYRSGIQVISKDGRRMYVRSGLTFSSAGYVTAPASSASIRLINIDGSRPYDVYQCVFCDAAMVKEPYCKNPKCLLLDRSGSAGGRVDGKL